MDVVTVVKYSEYKYKQNGTMDTLHEELNNTKKAGKTFIIKNRKSQIAFAE